MNKEKGKQYLVQLLRWLAIKTIAKYQPGIVVVTGSAGKTSAKEAIAAVLSSFRWVRATKGNFNNEIGVPLTILGNWNKIAGGWFWVKVVIGSFFRLLFRVTYPEVLVLEYAADRPGDIKYLLDIARPQIGVVTTIGEIPVHVEYYSGPEAVAREKSKVVECLPSTGFAILNFDDVAVQDMKQRTRGHVVTYGFSPEAEVFISNFEYRMEGSRPAGISFKLNYGGSFVPVKLGGCFGKAQAYAAAAGASVGLVFGLNLVQVSEALADYRTLPGRGAFVPGIKQTYILDDSYNASPLSMHAAIDTMKSLKAKRKVAVLGDMLEIGKYTNEAHETIGQLAGKTFDLLFTVGARAKFIAEAARVAGMAQKNIYAFDTADDAKLKVQELIRKGDLILIKASHSIALDKVVEEIRQV